MINRILASTALALALGVSAGAYAQTAPAGAVITQQQSSEMLAADIIGTNVRNAQNESIGAVSDLILDQNGQLKGAVISVGGFLGIGDKKVAVPWTAVQLRAPDTSASGSASGAATPSQDPVLMVSMTKDELKSAEAFKTVAQQRRDAERAARPAPSGAPATAPGTARPGGTTPSQ
jgi:sporulation protein YlmC with PRC-barrel domain